MSIGSERVGVTYNPSGSSKVDEVKAVTATLIDSMQPLVDLGGGAGRCAAIAQTKYEEAGMWAVKAITKPKKEA